MTTNQEQVLVQAGEWLLELQAADVPIERIAAWQQWLASDSAHRQAFKELQQTSNLLDNCVAKGNSTRWPWPTATELAGQHDVEGSAPHAGIVAKCTGSWGHALAATLIVAVVGVGILSFGRNSDVILQTGTGEHREARLLDGSRLSVGADSRLRLKVSKDQRFIELTRGEAFFDVATDPRRPFKVRSGSSVITALGTAFNVRRVGDRVVVEVSEGTVAVSRTSPDGRGATEGESEIRMRLDAGQRLVLEPRMTQPKIEAVALPTVADWRDGNLHYSGEPLSFVIADVNRYTDQVIVIADPTIAELRVTGTVSEGNVASWLTSLPESLAVEIVPNGSGELELRRRSN